MTAAEKTIDIIIPTYKPGKKFTALLEALARQTKLPETVIIINTEEVYWQGSEAEAAFEALNGEADSALFRKLCLIQIQRSAFDHGGTRRLGASQSKADAFLCMTDDAVPADAFLLEQLLEALYRPVKAGSERGGQQGCVAMAYARQLPAPDCSEAERFTRAFNYPEEPCVKTAADLPRLGIKTYFASNVCCAYDRRIYEKLGGFCEPAIFNEDMIFAAAAIRAGYAIAYVPKAAVIHSHNYKALQQLHRNFDLGMSQAMHPEVFAGLPSEGEGIRLVKKTAAHLCAVGRPFLLPQLFLQSGCKYLGYRLGKSWEHLPLGLVHALAMNRKFVEQHCGSRRQRREQSASAGIQKAAAAVQGPEQDSKKGGGSDEEVKGK